MEEKNAKKISLSTFLLIIAIAIIAIIVMGVFIYKINNEKTLASNKIKELNYQINNLQTTIESLQGKTENDSNIINKENNESTDNNNNNQSTNNSTINMEKIYLPQTFKAKGEESTTEANFEYYIEEEKKYIEVKVSNSEIECTVLNNDMKPSTFKPGKTIIKGCNERIVDVAFEYSDDGFVNSIFLLTSLKNVYACNIRYLYDISKDGIQANLILKDVISIGTTSGGYATGCHTVVALKSNGEYAICFDGERDGE